MGLLLADGFLGGIMGLDILGYVLVVVGAALVVVEIFLPGIGAPGIIGLICLAGGILMVSDTLAEALIIIAAVLVVFGAAFVIALRSAAKGRLSRSRLILRHADDREEGFVPADDLTGLLGKTGVALTILRPAGTGEFGSLRVDVVTDGVFIEKGNPIRVSRVDGQRVVVELAEK